MRAYLQRLRTNRDEGFSLMELLVVITLLSVVGTVVLSAIITTTRIHQKNESIVQQRIDAQTALQRMSRDFVVADPMTAAGATDASMRVYRDGYCEVHRWYVNTSNDLALDVSRFPASTTCTNAAGTLTTVGTTIVAEDVANGSTALFTYSKWSSATNARTTMASPVASNLVGTVDRVEMELRLATQSNAPIVEEEAVDLRNVEIR